VDQEGYIIFCWPVYVARVVVSDGGFIEVRFTTAWLFMIISVGEVHR
jgi:hypothetical protein